MLLRRGPLPLLAGLIVFSFALAGGMGQPSLFLGLGAWFVCMVLLAHRKHRAAGALAEKVQAFDVRGLHEELGRLRLATWGDADHLRMLEEVQCLAFMMGEEWAQALAHLERLDLVRLPPRRRVWALNNRAFCRAQLGDVGGALEESEAAFTQARAQDEVTQAEVAGVRGAVLVHAGRAEEAVPLLRRALSESASPRQVKAVRHFYLGEALRALGETEGARTAYATALGEDAPGSFAAKAEVALTSLGRS